MLLGARDAKHLERVSGLREEGDEVLRERFHVVR